MPSSPSEAAAIVEVGGRRVQVEQARSGRSRCGGCRKPIADRELRFGREEVDDRVPGAARTLWRWMHLDCAADAEGYALHRALQACPLDFPRKQELLEVTRNVTVPAEAPPPSAWWAAVGARDATRVAKLLTEGANPELRDAGGATALHQAAQGGDAALARALVQGGADKEARTNDRYSPLHLACVHGHLALVEILIDAGARIEARGGFEDEARRTALHWALDRHFEDAPAIVERLLHAGANPNARDAEGTTCLSLAIRRRSVELCRALLDAGARPDAEEGRRWGGWTPLHRAAWRGQAAIVRLLLERGAPVNARTSASVRWTSAGSPGEQDVSIPPGATPTDLAAAFSADPEVLSLLQAAGGARTDVPIELRRGPGR